MVVEDLRRPGAQRVLQRPEAEANLHGVRESHDNTRLVAQSITANHHADRPARKNQPHQPAHAMS